MLKLSFQMKSIRNCLMTIPFFLIEIVLFESEFAYCSLIWLRMLLYNNDWDQLLIFTSMTTSLLHSQLMRSHFLSPLIRLSVYENQVYLLGILITFVNIFYFNLVLTIVLLYFCIFCTKLNLFEATCFIILQFKPCSLAD